MRIDHIRSALKELPGSKFESFVRILLRRKLYPGLNTTSPSYDLGEDARTETTTLQLNDGRYYTVFVSKTATITKLKGDCRRSKETNRKIEIVVFAIGGNPREDTIENWKKEIRKDFGWELVVHPLEYIVEIASEPKFESLVDDFLHVPPIGGDFLQDIEKQFEKATNRAIRNISITIPGIDVSIEREEIKRIEDQIRLGRSVLLTGEAGSGKSGIAYQLTTNTNKPVLFLDARSLGHIKNDTELRNHIGLSGSIEDGILRLASAKRCRVIIDQLDNSIGLPVSDLLINLALDIIHQEGVEIIIVSRKREAHEIRFLNKLTNSGFEELNSNPLNFETVKNVLRELGVNSPNVNIMDIGKNLLNLEVIGRIIQSNSNFNMNDLSDEIELWEAYVNAIQEREGDSGEQIISEAIFLAKQGLLQENRSFNLDHARSFEQQRLESWKIIIRDHRRVFRFYHEKFQDFLYAFDAFNRGINKQEIIEELGDLHRTRSVLIIVQEMYHRHNPTQVPEYLRDAWNV